MRCRALVARCSADEVADLLRALPADLRNDRRPHGLRLLLTSVAELRPSWAPLPDLLLTIELPSLCQRSTDLPLLPAHVAPDSQWTPEALALLEQYAWSGNVAEFQRVVSQAAHAAGRHPVHPRHLPHQLRPPLLNTGPFGLPSEGIDLI